MASNYKELYKINERCWFKDCPVLLEKAGLFLNISTNKVIALCRYRNITLKRIKAVYLSLTCFGVDGAILNDDLNHVYLDLSIPGNGIFGEKTPISIPVKTTRKIEIAVTKVIFADNSYWENNDTIILQPILPANPSSSLGKLQEVYEWKTGFTHLPLKENDYWICGCDSFNPATNHKCSNCDAEKTMVFSRANPEYLENALSNYQEYLEQKRITAKEKNKKEKLALAGAVIALVIMIVGAAITYSDSPELKSAKYNADMMLSQESLIKSTLELAESYLYYEGKDSEEYQSTKEDLEKYLEELKEYEEEYEASKKDLNAEDLEKLNKYIEKRKAKYAND